MIPAQSTNMHITSHILADILVILPCAPLSAFNTNWVLAYLGRTEVIKSLTVTVARWIVPIKPLCFTVRGTTGASCVWDGTSRAKEAYPVVTTVTITLITIYADKTHTRLTTNSLSCINMSHFSHAIIEQHARGYEK